MYNKNFDSFKWMCRKRKKMLWCCIWMENNKVNYGKCFLGFSVLIMFVLWCGKDW